MRWRRFRVAWVQSVIGVWPPKSRSLCACDGDERDRHQMREERSDSESPHLGGSTYCSELGHLDHAAYSGPHRRIRSDP